VLDAPVSGSLIELSPVAQIQLSDVALVDLEELAPASLILEIRDDLGRHQIVRSEVDVYARDQWLGDPRLVVLTTAFVQPNHPDVARVMTRTSEILKSRGRPGISGYQAEGTGQHHAIAQAVFEALQGFVKTYINPPASFETVGQKLRPVDRVLDEGQGTCIDLACAYASCLEQAGLHPVLFVVPGHAFAGYITKQVTLTASVIDSWPAIQSLLDSKLIVAVETVNIPGQSSFEDAIIDTRRNLIEQPRNVIVDITKARQEGIRPLPARVLRDNVITVVIDNGPASPPIIERRDPTTRKLLPESLPARVQSWKNSLLDLSFRNRLLNLRPDRFGVQVFPPLDRLGWIEDHLNGGGTLVIGALDSINAVQAAVVRAKGLENLDSLRDLLAREHLLLANFDSKRFKTAVYRLRSDARLQEEETGANCLYLTLGSVKWASNYGDYESPIFLVPVRIKSLRGLNAAVIEMDDTQVTTVNYCLIEALRLREQMTLQWFSDDMSDESGLDIAAGLEALRTEFRERGLDLRGFSVDQTILLGLLDFKKFRLWKDLNDHWRDFASSPVVKHLIETPRETFQDPVAAVIEQLKIDDIGAICAQPADGSQIGAIERALAGSSFVLQGPPGSGKSQTITNLLANAMHRGRKVLFVAEKQAALQEVQERLEAVKLGPYCLVLHDSGTKPEGLRAQLRDALEQRPILDERTHAQFEDDFAAAARQMDTYRSHVYSKNNAGFSFAGAFFRLSDLGEGPIATVPRSFLDLPQDHVQELQRELRNLHDFTGPAQVRPLHPWKMVPAGSFDELDRSALAVEIPAALAACAALATASAGPVGPLLARCLVLSDLTRCADAVELRELGHLPSMSEWQTIADPKWAEGVRSSTVVSRQVISSVQEDVRGKEEFLRRTDLGPAASAISEAAKSFAVGRKGRVRKALGPFGEILDEDALESEIAVTVAQRVAAAAETLRDRAAELRKIGGLAPMIGEVPVRVADVDALEVRASTLVQLASQIMDPGADGASLRALVSSSDVPVPGLAAKVRETAGVLRALLGRLGATDASTRKWADGIGIVNAVHERSRDALQDDVSSGTFLKLQRWMRLQSHLEQYRAAGLEEMCSKIESGALSADDAALALERGLLITTLQVRAEETNLDVFDGAQHDRQVTRFIELLDERRKRAQTVIPYYLFKSRTINAGVTTGKVGEFRRELNTPSKRRRGRSIRRLLTVYPDIISDLTPCFMMSPDSVAQFLVPGSIKFDIVVFDEASQIVVADAIGAIGRSQSCVIVGDSKQMPPTKVGVVDAADDSTLDIEDDNVIEEEESILEEAVAAGFHQELLTWHYRSQDESLIAFSNDHYYDSRLSTFPAPVDVRADCGIFYRRVDGRFDHGKSRTNEVEARAILEELVQRLDDPATAGLSYGIVTLNIQQRNLVTEMIEQHDHPRIRELRETEDKKRRLFILNLENVQGRERDVIILGTSFSRREGGATMPLNFGPLTQRGGEKRLNVAVTRAKRQFVVVSSFDPEEMASATSLGMVHLREYLKAARRRAEREPRSVNSTSVAPQVSRVAEELRRRGIVVEVGRGLSKFKVDLALSLPEMGKSWLVAVLFDGEEWARRPLAIDRDALPKTVLEAVMHWRRVVRVWMPSLRLEFDQVIDALVSHVQEAKSLPDPTPLPPPPVAERAASVENGSTGTPAPAPPLSSPLAPAPAEPTGPLPNEVPFVAMTQFPAVPRDPNLLLTEGARSIVEQLIDTEGPLSAVEAIKRVAREFGLERVRDQRLGELSVLLGTRLVTEVRGEWWAWPAGVDPNTWRSFRRTAPMLRKVENIAPHEIVNAMEVTVRQSITIDREELIRWTGQFFGAGRISARLNEYLTGCLEWAIAEGRFVVEDGRLTCA
jgi:hypothetical protein